MATRSFLVSEQVEEGFQRLDLKAEFPENVVEVRRDFSAWLETQLRLRLRSLGDFNALDPVLLGSWARHELCPKSDIDLLFVGEEGRVKDYVANAYSDGLKLR